MNIQRPYEMLTLNKRKAKMLRNFDSKNSYNTDNLDEHKRKLKQFQKMYLEIKSHRLKVIKSKEIMQTNSLPVIENLKESENQNLYPSIIR